MTDCPGLTSAELLKETGITYRQLDYWCHVGYIEPHNHDGNPIRNPGSGTKRCFSLGEVAKVQMFKQLVAGGLEHERAWLMIRHPERIHDWLNYLAKLHAKLTGETITWQTYPSTPCG